MKNSRTLLAALALLVVAALVGGVWPDPVGALSGADLTYSIKLKSGVSKTVFGDAFKFTGKGTMTVNEATGAFSYSIELSNGLTFEGEGELARSTKNEVFAKSTTTSGGIDGVVIFTGKMAGGDKKFKAGKMYAAIPNRLGAAPTGFVYSTAKLSGTLKK
ncbi:MAG: hypothetical protein GKS06_06155 [Acidobacteria bacterium]|nr:hypothetical protein [Acidobacteriota bacterium]